MESRIVLVCCFAFIIIITDLKIYNFIYFLYLYFTIFLAISFCVTYYKLKMFDANILCDYVWRSYIVQVSDA